MPIKINNPLKMNDWGIKSFLIIVLSLQLIVGALVALEVTTGLEVPIIRQLISFVYITFVPGLLILRVLKLHKLGSIQTLLYSIGLSLAIDMFAGLLVNAFYPSFGIKSPMSVVPLTITFGIIVLGLCVLAYVRDRDFEDASQVSLLNLPPVLFLLLIPLLSILGTQLVNFHQSNVLLMALIAIIGLTVILIGFGKFIPRNLYPLAVFVIGLSLLYYRSLISTFISGFDIHEEYYVANLVIINGRWESTSTLLIVNSMPSISMLAPIFSNVVNLDLTVVLKVVYPLLFSFVPLGLYEIVKRQTDEKIAFLSSFFFVEAFQFYTEIAGLLRQQIATIFIICLTLLMIDKRLASPIRASLFVILGASLVISHYGSAYAYMFYLISAWLILISTNSQKLRKLLHELQTRFGVPKRASTHVQSLNNGSTTISIAFCLLFIVIALSWYMYIQDARVFKAFTTIGLHIVTSFNEFLNPEFSGGLNVLLTKVTPDVLHYLNAAINYLNQIILIVGIIITIKYRKWQFTKEYAVFSVLSLTIIFAGVFVPYFTRQVNIDRLYHLALIFLAPYPIIGGFIVLKMIGRVFRVYWKGNMVLNIVSVYFVVFFLFQTGFVWQITEGYSGSVSISQEGIKKFRNALAKGEFYSAITVEKDVFSAKWLATHRKSGEKIYAIHDDVSVHPLISYGMIPFDEVLELTPGTKIRAEIDYVYLQYVYVVERIARTISPGASWGARHTVYGTTEFSHLFVGKNKIYSNGGSEVFR